jgi:hypothetical protein
MTWCFLAEVADRSIGTKVHDCIRQNRSNYLDSALILIKGGSARAKITSHHGVLDGHPVKFAADVTAEGSIALQAEHTEGMVWVFVVETGIGIPQEALERIFEEYFQYDNLARNIEKGLGTRPCDCGRLEQLLGHPSHVHSELARD